MGCPELIVAVDHKPLIKILNDRELESISNPRLLRLKERTLMYEFNIIHLPRRSLAMMIADSASRQQHNTEREQTPPPDDAVTSTYAIRFAADDEPPAITWATVNKAASFDKECITLCDQIHQGFSERRDDLPQQLRAYWPMRSNLYVVGNVPFRDHRMLIPSKLRKIVLDGLHAAHQGINSMLANARERFFWPGLDAAIRLRRDQCKQCNANAPSQRAESPMETPRAEFPFEQVVVDLCYLAGHSYVVYADRYSGWIEVEQIPSTAFHYLKPLLLRWFAAYGAPTEVSSDGGPPFNSYEYNT
jgi:Integrase zinc binding domain